MVILQSQMCLGYALLQVILGTGGAGDKTS